jgi:hypothetical protein
LEILLVTFNVGKPSWLQMPGASNAKVYGKDFMSDDVRKYYLQQVNNLENDYQAGNWLQDKDRASYFPKLRKRIETW